MQMIQNSYRGFNLILQLGADRVFTLLAICLSLMAAAAIGFEIASQHIPGGPQIF